MAPAPVVVTYINEALQPHAQRLAQRLDLPLQAPDAVSEQLRLVQTGDGLELHEPNGSRLRLAYTPAELKRYRPGASGRDLLWRALGNTVKTVVDATAGLGRDSVHLACLGYRVTAIERNGVVSELAQAALAAAKALLGDGAPQWHTGDARKVLPVLDPPPDAVYLDPMFPAKRKWSAAARKEMQLLRTLVSDDADAGELFATACAVAKDRVVVKRADDAPPLRPRPSASYTGKTVRYDVYHTR